MAFPDKLSQLCTPSLVYFVLSIVGVVLAIFQNMGNNNKYCLGSFACQVPSTIAVFIVKFVCIFFWTWVLNLMCKDGHANIAWFLVLLPFILLLMIIVLIMSYQKDNKQKKQKKQITNTGGMGSASSTTMPYDSFKSGFANIEGMTTSTSSTVKQQNSPTSNSKSSSSAAKSTHK
jgi:H+/Cl- antiporter ClcA